MLSLSKCLPFKLSADEAVVVLFYSGTLKNILVYSTLDSLYVWSAPAVLLAVSVNVPYIFI